MKLLATITMVIALAAGFSAPALAATQDTESYYKPACDNAFDGDNYVKAAAACQLLAQDHLIDAAEDSENEVYIDYGLAGIYFVKTAFSYKHLGLNVSAESFAGRARTAFAQASNTSDPQLQTIINTSIQTLDSMGL